MLFVERLLALFASRLGYSLDQSVQTASILLSLREKSLLFVFVLEDEKQARNRIIKAAIELLDEHSDPARITVRQIAERAGVGTGLINYHFQTKDNLLQEAVSSVTGNLDDQTGAEIHDLLFALNEKRSVTLIAVTHNRALADRMPRRLLLEDGQVKERP